MTDTYNREIKIETFQVDFEKRVKQDGVINFIGWAAKGNLLRAHLESSNGAPHFVEITQESILDEYSVYTDDQKSEYLNTVLAPIYEEI